MADWQPGDLALCWQKVPYDDGLIVGAIYTVSGVFDGGFGLHLKELPLEYGTCWISDRFRKVTPPEADEFDREVIALLTGKPEQVTG